MEALFLVADDNKNGMLEIKEFFGFDVGTVIQLLGDPSFFWDLPYCERVKKLMKIVMKDM